MPFEVMHEAVLGCLSCTSVSMSIPIQNVATRAKINCYTTPFFQNFWQQANAQPDSPPHGRSCLLFTMSSNLTEEPCLQPVSSSAYESCSSSIKGLLYSLVPNLQCTCIPVKGSSTTANACVQAYMCLCQPINDCALMLHCEAHPKCCLRDGQVQTKQL